jgi:Ni/Co efflux regulator RcnB
MKKTRISIIVAALVMASPLAHASLASGAHQFKEDARTAGRDTGHAVGHAARAVGHGAKSAGHAVADATKHGYHATKKFVTGHA